MSVKLALPILLILAGCGSIEKISQAMQNIQQGNNAPLGQPQAPAPAAPAPVAPANPGTPEQQAALNRGFHPHDVALEPDPTNEKVTALQIIARDPTILGDAVRLKGAMLAVGQVAEQKVTEFDPYRIHPPGDPQTLENDTLHRMGWSIGKIGWDPAKKVYVLDWVRLRRATPDDYK